MAMRSTRTKSGLREIDIEQRFRSGEFEEAAVLKQAVEAFLPKFEKVIAQAPASTAMLAARKQRIPARASGCWSSRAATSSTVSLRTRVPQLGQKVWPTRAIEQAQKVEALRGGGDGGARIAAWCSSAGWRRPARCRRYRRPRAFPSAPGTGARRRRAIPRSGADPRHRWCRRRARICRTPRRP